MQFPFIGHMGIATSEGVIRDFAGPYYVSEGNMAFGEPTRYLKLQPQNAENGASGWTKHACVRHIYISILWLPNSLTT